MTAKQLKNSILKEAVQGKLVSQNNEDEPSSELLKRIKSERDKLINSNNNVASAHCINIQKKARKGLKPLVSSIYRKGNSFYEKRGKDEICIDAELPFEIPKSWELVRLKELCRLIDGEYREEELIILDAKFLRGKSEGVKSNSGKYVSAGDYLILVDGENSGEVFKAPINGYLGSTFKILWIAPFININYILYFIELYKLPLKNSKKGVAIPHLNRDLFFNLLLPLPPIEEQKRIVNKLNELMPLIEEYEKLESELNELDKKFPERLKKSILKEAFDGKLIKSSNKLKIKTLEEVCIYSSSNIALKDIKNKKGDYPVYGASGVVGYSDFYSKEKECVAVVKDGSVGKVFLLPAKSSVISTLHYLENTELLDIKYLYYFLQSINFLKYKIGAMIPHIYFRDYKKEKILIPPIEEQKRIVEKLDKLMELCEELKRE